MAHTPLVSICIPSYNRAGMIPRAIRSALDQTFTDIEVILVDNASTDNTNEVAAGFHDSRFRHVKNERNLGIFGNFNRCVEVARGKYLHILHSDDYIDRDFTRTCVEFLESHPDVAMTFGSVQPATGDADTRGSARNPPVIYDVPEGFRKILETRSFISCPTVMMRREIYDQVGFYSLEYPYSGDFYQWLRVSRQCKIASVPDAVLFYRTGTHSESFQLLFKTPLGYIDTIKVFVRIIDELGESQSQYQRELNIAYQRHMRDCLFASIARAETMSRYSGMIFIGFALSTWSLLNPLSFTERIKKCGNFFLIGAVACAILIPSGQYLVRKVLHLDTQGY